MADALKNFATSLVATAPSPATSGTSLVVTAGQGALFPAAPFNAVVWPAGVNPTTVNAEVVRVTVVSADTFTIIRAQEGSTAQSIAVGFQISQNITAALLDQYLPLSGGRLTKRVLALSANSATPAIDTDNYDAVHITAQTAAITSFTSGLTGTPVDGDTLRISITGTAAVALTWGTSFEASTVTLPTTTVTTARLDVGFFWDAETTKWRCVAVA